MLIMPAHRRFSIDAKRKPRSFSAFTCPQWCLMFFILQMAIVYTYAGIHKIYPAWMDGTTIGLFFSGKADFFLIGPLLANETFQLLVAWGGIVFDLLVVPLMLFRQTRTLGFIMLVFFHLFNSAVFHIGIFPYMMIGMAVFFYPPEKVDQWFFKGKGQAAIGSHTLTPNLPSLRTQYLMLAGFALYFIWQAALPARHHLFDSNVFWSEEGHRLSWRMMLRSKSGFGKFLVKDRHDPDAQKERAAYQDRLTQKQKSKVATHPDMAWQVAQRIHAYYQAQKDRDVAVYYQGKAALNGRSYQRLIDPEIDLAAQEWPRFQSKAWVVPLRE